jgi:hypothetical protein
MNNFYQILGIDFEQLCPEDQEADLMSILEDLLCYDSKEVHQFFHLRERIFLHTTVKDPVLGQLEIESAEALPSLIQSETFDSTVRLGQDYAYFNSTFYSFVSITKLPKSLSYGELSYFGDYFVNVKKLSSAEARTILEISVNTNASSQISKRDFKGEATLSEGENLLEALEFGAEDLLEFEIYFVLQDIDEKSLRLRQRKLVEELKRARFTPLIETVGLHRALQLFVLKLPPKFERKILLNGSVGVNLLPLSQDRLMDNGAEFLSTGNVPLSFELFNSDSINFNMLITGETGRGKSLIAMYLMLHTEGKKIIFDPKGDFSKVVKYHGGKVLSGSFNPYIPDPCYLKELICSCVELDIVTKGRLLKTLMEMDLSQYNGLQQLIEAISQDFPSLEYSFIEIWPYLSTQKMIENEIILINLINYPDRVLSLLLIFLIQHIDSIEGKKTVILDECHRIMAKNGEWVGLKMREMRSKQGSLIAISQTFDEFTSTSFGKVIANNTFYKVFFAQSISKGDFIDDFDVDKITSLKMVKRVYSQFYLKSGHHRKQLRYKPDPLTYELCTSDPEDRKRFARYEKNYKDYLSDWDILHKYVDFKYSRGN